MSVHGPLIIQEFIFQSSQKLQATVYDAGFCGEGQQKSKLCRGEWDLFPLFPYPALGFGYQQLTPLHLLFGEFQSFHASQHGTDAGGQLP